MLDSCVGMSNTSSELELMCDSDSLLLTMAYKTRTTHIESREEIADEANDVAFQVFGSLLKRREKILAFCSYRGQVSAKY